MILGSRAAAGSGSEGAPGAEQQGHRARAFFSGRRAWLWGDGHVRQARPDAVRGKSQLHLAPGGSASAALGLLGCACFVGPAAPAWTLRACCHGMARARLRHRARVCGFWPLLGLKRPQSCAWRARPAAPGQSRLRAAPGAPRQPIADGHGAASHAPRRQHPHVNSARDTAHSWSAVASIPAC